MLTYTIPVVIAWADLTLERPGDDDLPRGLVVVIACAMLALSLGALSSVIAHRWRWEWVAAFWLAALLCVRAGIVWSDPGPPPPIADAAAMTGLATFILLRGLDLTVFAIKTGSWSVRLARAEA